MEDDEGYRHGDGAPQAEVKHFRLSLHPGDEYVGSLEPQSLQVLTYLKFVNCCSEVSIELTCFSSTPVFRHRDERPIKGAYDIISYLKNLGYDVDTQLSQQNRSEILAYADMLSDRLLPAILCDQWLDAKNYLDVTRLKYASILAFPLSMIYLSSHRKSVRRIVMRDASLESTEEERRIELLERATECLSLLSAKLGTSHYLYGDHPTSLDALVFGYLEVIGQCPLTGSNVLCNKLHSCKNLFDYCRRIRRDCFPLMKHRVTNHSVAKDSAEETNIWKAPGFWISVGVAVAVLGLQAMRVWPIPRTR